MRVLKSSVKERNRLEAFALVKREEVSLRLAAELVELSCRQTLRSYDRFKKREVAGDSPAARPGFKPETGPLTQAAGPGVVQEELQRLWTYLAASSTPRQQLRTLQQPAHPEA